MGKEYNLMIASEKKFIWLSSESPDTLSSEMKFLPIGHKEGTYKLEALFRET